jgi:hypothetical protein
VLLESHGRVCIGGSTQGQRRRSREQQTSQAPADIRSTGQFKSSAGNDQTVDSRRVGIYSVRNPQHVRNRQLRRVLWRLAQVLTVTTGRKMGGGRLRRGSRPEQRPGRAAGGSFLGRWLRLGDCGSCKGGATSQSRSRRAERSEGLQGFRSDVTGRGRPPSEISDRPSPLPPSRMPTPGCTT